MHSCFQCSQALDVTGTVGRTETCPFCAADLHCCCNCAHHDHGSYNECRETQAERVLDKDRSNFCDYFSFKSSAGGKKAGPAVTAGKSNPLDRLFKKSH